MTQQTHEPLSNEDELRQGAQENVNGPSLSVASTRVSPNAGTAGSSVETGRLQRAALGSGFTIADLIRESFETSRSKGWHDPAPSTAPTDPTRRSQVPVASFGDRIALIHSEASEALEAYRFYADPTYTWHRDDGKPEGVPSELADIIIRIADACGLYGIDLESAIIEKCAFNRTRPLRHGGKAL